jgi:glyoxylase-like metal-dependent hydrolase (beta-lactamase superfamily II)
MTIVLKAADLGVTLPRLPLDRTYDPRYGEAVAISPLLRRVLAPNPGPFTFHGTGTYIVGHGRVAVIDPGPLLDAHVDALCRALDGETVTHILVTHTHNDHSPAALPLQRATGAPIFAFGPHGAGKRSAGIAVEEGGDMAFEPDVLLADGEVIAGDGWTLDCVYTPGHTSNHLCFGLREERCLFSGDHVMGWSTTVIVPPDGDMAQYLTSLSRLQRRDDVRYYPTHGTSIEAPAVFLARLVEHRHARERQIVACLARGIVRIRDMVRVIYSEVEAHLHPAAAMSVLAHLEHMVASGTVGVDGSATLEAIYRLA